MYISNIVVDICKLSIINNRSHGRVMWLFQEEDFKSDFELRIVILDSSLYLMRSDNTNSSPAVLQIRKTRL